MDIRALCHPEVNDVMRNGLADKVYKGDVVRWLFMAINSNVVSHFFHFRPDEDWGIQSKRRQSYLSELKLVTIIPSSYRQSKSAVKQDLCRLLYSACPHN